MLFKASLRRYWKLQFKYGIKYIDLEYQCLEVLYNNSMVCNPNKNCQKMMEINIKSNLDHEQAHKMYTVNVLEKRKGKKNEVKVLS